MRYWIALSDGDGITQGEIYPEGTSFQYYAGADYGWKPKHIGPGWPNGTLPTVQQVRGPTSGDTLVNQLIDGKVVQVIFHPAEIPIADEVIEWQPAWTTGDATYNKKYNTVCAPFPNNAPPSNVRYVGNIGSQCPPDEVCIMAEPYLVGSFTENELYLLEQGVPVALTSSADIYQEVRIDPETGRLVLWEAKRSINCYDLSPFRKVFSWSLNTIKGSDLPFMTTEEQIIDYEPGDIDYPWWAVGGPAEWGPIDYDDPVDPVEWTMNKYRPEPQEDPYDYELQNRAPAWLSDNDPVRYVVDDVQCYAMCVDDPSTPDIECGSACPPPTSYLLGRFTEAEWKALMLGEMISLAPETFVHHRVKLMHILDEVQVYAKYNSEFTASNDRYNLVASFPLWKVKDANGPNRPVGSIQVEPPYQTYPCDEYNGCQMINDPIDHKDSQTSVLNDRWSLYGFEESSHLVGRFTPNEWMRLQAGNAVDLVVAGESEKKDLAYGIQIQKAPDNRPGYMIFSGNQITPFLFPTAQIASENAPLSGGAVLSDVQLDELAKGNRVYVDESLYYEYTPATDTLRLINEIDGSVVKQGTFQTIFQVNKDGSAASGGLGILLALGVVGIALSMSNRKSKP